VQLGAVLGGEARVGQDVVLAPVHERGELRPAGPELVGHLPPDLVRARLVGLQERLAQRRGDHRLLALAHVRQGAPHPVHDPNAIDALRFSTALAFVWPAIAKPRQRRPPVR
jgi:hypothetical protein